MKASHASHTWISHVKCWNKPRHTDSWVTSRIEYSYTQTKIELLPRQSMNASRHSNEWVISFWTMCHVTKTNASRTLAAPIYECVTLFQRMSHIILNNASRHSNECVTNSYRANLRMRHGIPMIESPHFDECVTPSDEWAIWEISSPSNRKFHPHHHKPLS